MPCKRFQIHADLAAEIALDDILAVLDGMNDLGELLLRQILGAHAGIDLGVGEDDFALLGPIRKCNAGRCRSVCWAEL